MEIKALEIVEDYIRENIFGNVHIDELFIVWSCYILGNRKLLIGWEKSNHYFEVTFNKTKNEWYLDVYEKKENKLINNN